MKVPADPLAAIEIAIDTFRSLLAQFDSLAVALPGDPTVGHIRNLLRPAIPALQIAEPADAVAVIWEVLAKVNAIRQAYGLPAEI